MSRPTAKDWPVTTKRVEDVTRGDRFIYEYAGAKITCLVLDPNATVFTDLFGRSMVRLNCRRTDTGAKGWVPFGPGHMIDVWRIE